MFETTSDNDFFLYGLAKGDAPPAVDTKKAAPFIKHLWTLRHFEEGPGYECARSHCDALSILGVANDTGKGSCDGDAVMTL